MQQMLRFSACRVVWSAAVIVVIAGAARADERLRFNRDVRPLLSDKCFACHGPSAKTDEGVIRLDLRDELVKADKDGHAVLVPGKPDKSELIRRILSTDESTHMPPPDSKKTLTKEQKDLLVRWVKEGADYESHWGFETPHRPELPAVKNTTWPRNAIDQFVLARLDKEKLSPSPEADKATLLRRLSLDLIGLPPTIAELDAFLADKSANAYSKQVERLLASPHYGERWGRIWLDAARYADSDGYEKDKPRFVSRYRDWVINSLNRDLPYNDFIIDQIAGDLRPNPTQDQLVATGFLRNSMINEEGGVDPEQFRMEAMFDRMDAIGKSMLGLTIQCSQCHNHKYDPLTQEEYYKIFAFLNNSHEGSVATYTPEQLQQRASILRQVRELESEYQHRHPESAQQVAAWEEAVRSRQAAWSVVQTAEDDPSGGQKMYRMKDGSFLCQGYAPTKHTAKIEMTVKLPKITAFRLEQLNDQNLPMGGPGRSIQGTAALTEFKVKAWPVGKPKESKEVKFKQAVASTEAAEHLLPAIYYDKTDKKRLLGPVAFAIDGKEETAWGIDVDPVRRNRPCQAVFVAEKPIEHPEGTVLEVALVQNHGGWNSDDNQNNNLGRFRLSVASIPASDAVTDLVPPDVRAIIDTPHEKRSAAQNAALFSAWLRQAPECADVSRKIEELLKQHPEPVSQLVLQERRDRRITNMLARGDFLKPEKPVTPGAPAFLHAMQSEKAQPTRLDFARWIVDPKSPTTARSLVNRIWQAYFGEGIVTTSDDLGTQCTPPSHPELLDWLAVDFMDHGWSVKNLHRTIVESATYRQSSRVSPELVQRDPQNRLLARGARFRVDAELVRDIALAASGLLNPKVGGQSVFPPAPDFLFKPPASYGPKTWAEDHGAERYRRALYTFRFRSVPYPVLQTFDAPNADVSCVRRSRSNTPLQALTTLNEPLFLEAARALARHTVAIGTDNAKRLTQAFRECTSRAPSEQESKILLAMLQKQQQRFSDKSINPWDFAADDPQYPPKLPDGVPPADLAAWTAVCRVLLNLDETITKE